MVKTIDETDEHFQKGTLIRALIDTRGINSDFILSVVKKYNGNHEFSLEEIKKQLSSELFDSLEDNRCKAVIEIRNNLNKNIKYVCALDSKYPKKLYAKKDPVFFLYYRGNVELINTKCIAIIGTRTPTEPFIALGNKIAYHFASKGYTIVSGLALGCDTIAHQACLDAGGRTVAVLPSPCDEIVPKTNNKLSQDILRSDGLLISEYGVGTKIQKYNYPRRDRIQSLLSDAVIVIQATDESGTMYAVKKSIKDGVKVFAIDGNNISLIDDYVNIINKQDLDRIENEVNNKHPDKKSTQMKLFE